MLKDAKGRTLAKRVVHFRSVWSQAWGLRLRKPAAGTAYVFHFREPVRHTVHLLFVFWPIDLYFLDKKGVVVDLKKGFRPFTVYAPKEDFWYAIETEQGLFSLKRGDKAVFPK